MQATGSRKSVMAIAGLALLAILAAVAAVTVNSGRYDPAKQLSLGEKFLAELDYENAILCFDRVIEVEPANVRAYLGLAEAYVGKGDFEAAAGALMRGYEITNDLSLREKLVWAQSQSGGDYEVAWADAEFERRVRQALGKPQGAILRSELDGVTSIELVGDRFVSLNKMTTQGEQDAFWDNYDAQWQKYDQYVERYYQEHPETDLGDDEILREQFGVEYDNFLQMDGDPMESGLYNEVWVDGEGYRINGDQGTRPGSILSIADLAHFRNLTKAAVSANAVKRLPAIPMPAGLRLLYLEANRLESVEPATALLGLEALHIGFNRIADLSPLAQCARLTDLWLCANPVEDISPLSGLTGLRELCLEKTHRSSEELSAIAPLANLETLYLFSNELTGLSALSGLQNLDYLNLSDNRITDVTPLSGLTRLTGLDLSENRISDVSPLASLSDCTHLGLADNPVGNWDVLSGFPEGVVQREKDR